MNGTNLVWGLASSMLSIAFIMSNNEKIINLLQEQWALSQLRGGYRISAVCVTVKLVSHNYSPVRKSVRKSVTIRSKVI